MALPRTRRWSAHTSTALGGWICTSEAWVASSAAVEALCAPGVPRRLGLACLQMGGSTGAQAAATSRGDYARAQAAGVTCVPLLVETFGGLSPALMHELRAAAEWRSNKLTSSEYDETTWSARTWLTFVAQRLSVAVQLSVAQEAAEALGLSVAADPRAR